MKSAFIVAVILFRVLLLNIQVAAQHTTGSHDSLYRPRIHFSPKAHWMNDPNGMVYYKGTYHLFYQYHPYSSVWGPMHWGHATSRNLIHWEHQPIAIYPDSLGTIFSGSAVVDINNTSGFGSKGQVPLVAIFTQHDEKAEKAGKNDFQNQSLAYSLDDGKTWSKYDGNPVLQNPGIRDFRDPKVMWHQPTKKWIMSLAVADRIFFYSSPDLKKWSKESEFGESAGAHGGVWECPDLFSLDYDGRALWVLVVSLNPGGPNKGSATQYFIGDFDGKNFSPYNTETKWLDYGPDDYAGITWSGTGNRKIFLGWMSNWMYANIVPTESWRSAATLPRELKIKNTGNDMLIASQPVKELSAIRSKPFIRNNIFLGKPFHLAPNTGPVKFPCLLDLAMDQVKDFSITLLNEAGNELVIGYDGKNNRYFIDRTRSGNVGFHQEFAAIHTAPRFSSSSKMDMTLVIDVSSAELFADDGLTVMTQLFFPHAPFTKITIQSAEGAVIKKLEYSVLKEGR
ncbi:MAG: glycoside hydrolase family 32 protein [Chitinophagaceae bacterium]|nr:glycoside hydrolase family 32 protein [Chitinophagaceae bacterium]